MSEVKGGITMGKSPITIDTLRQNFLKELTEIQLQKKAPTIEAALRERYQVQYLLASMTTEEKKYLSREVKAVTESSSPLVKVKQGETNSIFF